MIRIKTALLVSLLLVIGSLFLTDAQSLKTTQSTVSQSNDLIRVYGEDLSSNIFRAVSEENYLNLIIKLTENGSRPSGADNNRYARDWIVEELRVVSNGRIEAQMLGAHESVVGRLPGYLGLGPVLMVGGHYDSVHGSPGANDDATGVAAAIELARVFSRYEWPLDIYFCAWNAEEIGLIGSHEVAKIFDEWNIEILTYYNIDMLLVEDTEAPSDERVILGYSGAAMNYAMITDFMSKANGKDLIKSVEGTEMSVWGRSDHASFLTEGFDSVIFAFESGSSRDTAYHSPNDRWDNSLYNYTVAIDAVASIGASMAYTMARAHIEPMTKVFTGRLRNNQPSMIEVPITVSTNLEIKGSWVGGGFTLKIISPQGFLLTTINITETSGDRSISNFTVTGRGTYSFILSGQEGSDARFNLGILYDTDLDMNGILDRYEFWLDASQFQIDDDGDTLSNALETIIGTSPYSQDSDDDYLPDFWEYTYGTDATRPDAEEDPDHDFLDNSEEYAAGTHPMLADSDGDQIIDSWEVINGTDALTPDADLDPDGDSLTNLEEYRIGTYPLLNDSDADSMPDYFEVMFAFDPTRDDSYLDADGDQLTNLEEYLLGTNPRSIDSDQDLMPDNFEVQNGLNPLFDDSMEDPDYDGASNLEEYLQGTNPRIDTAVQLLTLRAALILSLG
ncbi:MAG: M28 family peptidase, partial [Candidatus Thorarchaeota archaeon]